MWLRLTHSTQATDDSATPHHRLCDFQLYCQVSSDAQDVASVASFWPLFQSFRLYTVRLWLWS